jgi:radical SAM-linked protein
MTILDTQSAVTCDAARRQTVLIQYALAGDLRFLSHHEEIRMLTRALLRAGWPLAYSRGFNPQPRLSLPLPRRVGTVSESEFAVVEIDAPPDLQRLFDALAAELPVSARLLRIASLPTRAAPQPLRARYAVDLEPGHARDLAPALADLLASPALPTDRSAGPDKPARRIDLRPHIETITLAGNVLTMCLIFRDQRTARPGELLTILKLPAAEYEHRVRQLAVELDIAPERLPCWPPGMERITVDQETNNLV